MNNIAVKKKVGKAEGIMKSLSILFLFLIFTLTFSSCGTGDDDFGAALNFTGGATNIKVDHVFSVAFKGSVDASTVDTGSYFIAATDTAASISPNAAAKLRNIDTTICDSSRTIPATVGASSEESCDRTFTLTPDSPLEYGTEYALCLTSAIKSCFGASLLGMMETFSTAGKYSVGGDVNGLDGTVVLQNNEADDLTITEDGEFAFPSEVDDGSAYAVTVLTQPDAQTCTVSNGTGTVSGADVTDVEVTCSEDAYSVGGTVDGLIGTVILQNNGSHDLHITDAGEFTFATEFADGSPYAVTVLTHPDTQMCTITNGTGVISGADVTDVEVACADQLPWARSTVVAPDSSELNNIATDSNGNVYLVGEIRGASQFDFGNGATVSGADSLLNPAIIKYDSEGNAQWARSTVSSSSYSEFHGISTDGDNNSYAVGFINGNSQFDFGNSVTVTGAYGGGTNAVVVKYDSSGNVLWAKSTVTAPDDSIYYGVSSDSSGNSYVAGSIDGTSQYDFGNGVTVTGANVGNNAVVVKYDSSGNAQWAKSVVSSSDASRFMEIVFDGSGNVYAVGSIVNNLQFDFGNGVTVSGAYNMGRNSVIVKYDSSGDTQWAKSTVTAPGTTRFLGVSSDSSGNVYAAGFIRGTTQYDFGNSVTVTGAYTVSNAVVVKYDSNGDAQWARSTVTAPDESEFNSISTNSNGKSFAVGFIDGNSQFDFGNSVTVTGAYNGENTVIVKYDSNGDVESARSTVSASNASILSGVSTDGIAKTYAVGLIRFNLEFDFGDGTTVTGAYAGGWNGLIMRYVD